MRRASSLISLLALPFVGVTAAHADLARYLGGWSQVSFGGDDPVWRGHSTNFPIYGQNLPYNPNQPAVLFDTDVESSGPGVTHGYLASSSWFSEPDAFGIEFGAGAGIDQTDTAAPFGPTVLFISILADFVLDETLGPPNSYLDTLYGDGTFDSPAGTGSMLLNSRMSIMTAPNVFTPIRTMATGLAWTATGPQEFGIAEYAFPGYVVPVGTVYRLEVSLRFEVTSAGALSELRGGGRFVMAPTPGTGALLGLGSLWALRRRRS